MWTPPWLETDGERVFATGPALTLHYEAPLRAELRQLLDIAGRLAADDPALRDIERRLTDEHAIAVAMLGRASGLIGFHGQTILHAPDQRKNLADPATPAAWRSAPACRLCMISARPMSRPAARARRWCRCSTPLWRKRWKKPLLVVNIGGVANATFLGEDGEILACDTGPGNGPLDDFVRARTGDAYDKDGALAAAGHARQDRLAGLMAHPYFARPAPKSLDRLSFSALIDAAVQGLAPEDGAATLTAFTVAAIAAAPFPARPKRVLVCGGGRKNLAIMARLQKAFACSVAAVETVGWDGDALEAHAECFAFLAVRSLYGLPLSLPGTTGAPAPLTGGAASSSRHDP